MMDAMLVTDERFLLQAALALALSFMIGLEFHNTQRVELRGEGFGTTRTLALIGLAGFLARALDASGVLFSLGFLALAAWLALYYQSRLREHDPSLMPPLVGLLVYLLGLLAASAPPWFTTSYAVAIVFFLSAKPRIHAFADTLSQQEVATAAKFIIMAGVVLPLLPDRPIAGFIAVTFRDVWFAAVAVSGVSYLSYLAGTYLFKRHGTLVTAILGGLYSSTATTLVLMRKARESGLRPLLSPALMLASAMMYVRLLALAALLVPAALPRLATPMLAAAAATVLAAYVLLRWRPAAAQETASLPARHPLEFQVALLFAGLYVVFASVTGYVVEHYGETQLEMAAFLVGFTEIDPFVLSVLSPRSGISLHAAVDAVVLATAGNNLLKTGIVLAMTRGRGAAAACGWLTALALASLAYVVAWTG